MRLLRWQSFDCFVFCALGSVLPSDFILDQETALEALSSDASVVFGLAYLMDIDTHSLYFYFPEQLNFHVPEYRPGGTRNLLAPSGICPGACASADTTRTLQMGSMADEKGRQPVLFVCAKEEVC